MESTRRPMKILLYSRFYLPTTVGVETYVRLVVEGLVREGHYVTVVTESAAEGFDDHDFPFSIIRQPGWAEVVGASKQKILERAEAWLKKSKDKLSQSTGNPFGDSQASERIAEILLASGKTSVVDRSRASKVDG